jgi:hypothetical protein
VTFYQAADNDTDTWGETSGDVPMKPVISCPNPQSSKQVPSHKRTLLFSVPHFIQLPFLLMKQDDSNRSNYNSSVKYGPGGSMQPPNGDWNKARSLSLFVDFV